MDLVRIRARARIGCDNIVPGHLEPGDIGTTTRAIAEGLGAQVEILGAAEPVRGGGAIPGATNRMQKAARTRA